MPQVEPPSASHSKIPLSISGCTVGLLDPTQKERLLSSPDSKLSFATFHPRTASANASNPRKLSAQQALCSSKRIVIESLPTGESFWRWVPRARGVESADEEGQWPRVIEICGQFIHCSQEQWDIYKLDPEYDCLVQLHPKITIISRKKGKERADTKQDTSSERAKHRMSSPGLSEPDVLSEKPAKQARRNLETIDEDNSGDEDEVAEMVIDENLGGIDMKAAAQRKKERLSKMEETRNWRRGKNAERTKHRNIAVDLVDLTLDDSEDPPHASKPQSQPNGHFSKRSFEDEANPVPKRARTRSPPKPKFSAPKRTRGWQQKYSQRISQQREFRDQNFMQGLFQSYTPGPGSTSPDGTSPDPRPNGAQNGHAHPPPPEEDPVSLEEKIRRMAEINKFEASRAEKEQRQKEAEAEAAEKARQEEEQRIKLERERLRQEEEQRRRRKRQEHDRWSFGVWTVQRALERYRSLAEAFDGAKFTPENPVDFEDIPWPVLHRPFRFTVQDVDWSAVEAFFTAVKEHMRSQDYKDLIEKSHKRFHPDRWRARRVLQSLVDDEVRATLEVAANTIAQAITPIWREVKGG